MRIASTLLPQLGGEAGGNAGGLDARGRGSVLRVGESSTLPASTARAAATPVSSIPIRRSGRDLARGPFDRGGGHAVRGGLFRRAYGIHFSRRLQIDRRSGPSLLQPQHALFDAADNLVVLLVVFEKVGNVQKGVAVEANIDKRRLHAR